MAALGGEAHLGAGQSCGATATAAVSTLVLTVIAAPTLLLVTAFAAATLAAILTVATAAMTTLTRGN